MTVTPQITGYQFDQRLLEHPLAEVWRGRSMTGMEVVALVLSEVGAADPQVRERLNRASRGAALSPGQQETPLWAANLTAARPYAITQLVPGQSGAERLFDPLDGLLGNDEESLNAVRQQLAQYGAEPPSPAELPWAQRAQDGRPDGSAGQYGGQWTDRAAPATGPGGPTYAGGPNNASGPSNASDPMNPGGPSIASDPTSAGGPSNPGGPSYAGGRIGAGGPMSPTGPAGAGGPHTTGGPMNAAGPMNAGGASGTGGVAGAAGGMSSADATDFATPAGSPGHHAAAQPGSQGPTQGDGSDPASSGLLQRLEAQRQRLGSWSYVIVVVIVLFIFSLTYSIGGAIGSAVKDAKPITQGPAPAPVSPGPLPSPALKPGIVKAKEAPYQPQATQVALVGATYEPGADVQVVEDIGLPFAFGWPRPPTVEDRGESSYAIYRGVRTGKNAANASLDARIAVRPCGDLARCRSERAAFDRTWTTYFKAPVPGTAKGDRTWLTVRPAGAEPSALTMTHAFNSGGRWWLVGAMVTGVSGEEPSMQRVLNDIRTQAG